MKIDRSKFKATSVEVLKGKMKEVGIVVKKKNSGRPGYLDIDIGTNKFRLYPAYPEHDSFIVPKVVHWLPQEIDKDGVKEIVRRPIFNSKVHAKTEKDLIEEYIKFATNLITDEVNGPSKATEKEKQKEIAKLIFPMTDWEKGISAKTSWVCYADKLKISGSEFGRLEFSDRTAEKMNNLCIGEQADEPIMTDPFSDPDDGKALIIVYNNKEKKKDDYYKLSLEWRGKYQLTEKQLEDFMELEPLQEIFKYRTSDFTKSLEGLRIFDEQNKIGVFAHDEWLDIVEEIAGYYPDSDEESDSDDYPEENAGNINDDEPESDLSFDKKEEDGEPEENVSSDVDLDNMGRKDLKKFIRDNNLPIMVTQSHSDDDIRGAIREELADLEEERKSEEPEEKEPEKPVEKEKIPWKKESKENVKTTIKKEESSSETKSDNVQDDLARKREELREKLRAKMGGK